MEILVDGRVDDDLEAPKQQWRLKPSPRKSGDSFSFDASIDSVPSSSLAPTSATPKKIGILKQADTPGTGQSVRFGKRLYDDGDESRMSVSTANNSAIIRSPGSISQSKDLSEDSVDLSLGFIRSNQTGTLQLQDDDSDESDDEAMNQRTASPTLQQVLDQHTIHEGVSMGTMTLPDFEGIGGYSNLEDVSFLPEGEMQIRQPLAHKQGITTIDGDFSFNESFLQAEMELAKKHMQEEENRRRDTCENFKRLVQEESMHSSDPTVLADPKTSETESNLDEHQGTPWGANMTQASEYMSTKSQFTARSPTSTIPDWLTPGSSQSTQEHKQIQFATWSSTDASSSMMNVIEDSPSVQRMNRRLSVGAMETSKSLSLVRLQSYMNTPGIASPLHNVIGSYPPSPWLTMKNRRGAAIAPHDVKEGQVSSSNDSISLRTSNTTAETQDTLYDVLQETNTLDSIHSERSEKLMNWAREAEEQSRIDRRMLLEERSKAERLMKETENANTTLQVIREEEKRLEDQRREKMTNLEELVARLYSQLAQKDSEKGEAKQTETMMNTKEQVDSSIQSEEAMKEEVMKLRAALEKSQAECDGLKKDNTTIAEDKDRVENLLENIREEHREELGEKEAAYKSLERELEGLKEVKEQIDDCVENEKEALYQQLIKAQEENSRVESDIVKAERELEKERDERMRLKEAMEVAQLELEAAKLQVEEGSSDLEVLKESMAKERAEMQETYQRSIDAATREAIVLQRKMTELEEENDNLLQSLAEVEDHRRSMEEDFLAKRDIALQESKTREEEALALAEEIQNRLEKVEVKLEKMSNRTTMLEHEVGDRGLEIVKLEKAKQRLEDENMNYSIALSAKQQELNLLKRNGGKSIRNTPASAARIAMKSNSSMKRNEMSAIRPLVGVASSRRLLGQVQETATGDESGMSLAPLQSGPTNIKTMRRKTMDVDNTVRPATVSAGAKVFSKPRETISSSDMLPPSSTMSSKATRMSNARQKSPEEETKVLGTSSQTSSRASSRQSSIMTSSTSNENVRAIDSRRSSSAASSNQTVQAKAVLFASIVASQGPMDISELQVPRFEAPLHRRFRIEDQKKELERSRVPSKSPELIAIPA